jgi:hypothetical protein
MMRLGLFAATLGGCSSAPNLYPVNGPLSEVKPLPVSRARVDGILGNSGRLALTMPDGERSTGQWSSAACLYASFGSGTLFSQHGSAYWRRGSSRSGLDCLRSEVRANGHTSWISDVKHCG